MTKQEEIKLLKQLKGDTYFNQFFNDHDIDIMCDNIKNDLAIEMDCQFNHKASILEDTVANLKKEIEKINYTWATRLLEIDNKTEEEIYDIVKSSIGLNEIIKYKRAHKIELSEAEVDYLVSLISTEK